MRTNEKTKKIFTIVLTIIYIFTTFVSTETFAGNSTKIVYPLQTISKLECRFQKFDDLSSNCKEDLPILHTKDYQKYAKLNDGYNDYTRLYTVLWGASYTYGWDQGYGGHMGVDIATAEGTPIYAMADGKVITATYETGHGNVVSIRHTINGKTIVSNYAHMSKIIAKKGKTVKAGDLIGKVGSTGNSTGNHLHFQIDTKTTYSPIYYDYKTCKYSYNKIINDGVCFSELEKITVDPLKFLETSGGILNDIKITTPKNNVVKTTTKTTTKNSSSKELTSSSIFNKTVYVGYSYGDIREVQTIYKSLGYYKGEINGNYRDVEKSVIDYQIKRGVIKDKNAYGAGRFGPSTRAQTKKDWEKFLAKGGKIATTEISGGDNNATNNETENVVNVKTKKIERKNLLTREQIEKIEVDNFIKDYNINLNFANPGSNVEKGKTEIIKLNITDRKGRGFRGVMPGNMTFVTNVNKVEVFPKKLFYFTDGKRDIRVTGVSEGITKLYIKIGNVTVKTFNIKVYNGGKTIYPVGAKLYGSSSVVMGNINKGLAVFKDNSGKNLINLAFGSTFKLKASAGNKVCIKSGSIRNIKQIYAKNCRDSDFKEEIDFSYKNTVGGILIYDFIALNKNAKFEIINNYNKKVFVAKNISISQPKGMKNNYVYKDEVMNGIENGITIAGMKKGYFMEDWELKEVDGYNWIKSSLNSIIDGNASYTTKNTAKARLKQIEKVTASRTKTLTRIELATLVAKYLNFDKNTQVSRTYKDLNTTQNKIVNTFFGKTDTWKDQFGKSYFRPNEKITRGEGVYLLMTTLENSNTKLLTLK